MKLKQMMFMKIFIEIKICLILVIIPRDSKFFDLVNQKVIGKMKDEFKEKIVAEFVEFVVVIAISEYGSVFLLLR